ncbi:response regulator receiver domain protein, partial [gut metagenome]
KNWNYVGDQRAVTYTNLPKGHYSFKVRSTNADGVWVDNERKLDVEVLPSFWETPAAYLLYFLLLILVIVTAVYILFTIYRLKHRVLMEHQMTDMKLRFFTDISHELRTPLTLIVGPVENVLKNYVLPDDVRSQLNVVARNTNRMLRLINQILDFRKIQNKKMKLRVQCIDIVPFTRCIMDNFVGMAEERHITFKLESAAEKLFLWADADKYEKIVFNLLSNAFKYTPDGKTISVFIREDEKHLSVGIQDQGVGIEENRLKSIFLRFENLVDRNLFTQSSTGIGLSLVKELVEMHQATISLESRVGEGSCFRVDFLKGKEHYDASVEFLQDDVTAAMNVSKELD